MTNPGYALMRLIDRIEALERKAARLDARVNNVVREGRIVEVDNAKGTVRVDAHGIETGYVPMMQQAGEVNEWTPMAVGQRVVLISPSGDVSRSFAMPGGYTDEVSQPHDKGAEKRITIGSAVLTFTGDGLTIETGGAKFELTSAGFKQTGGRMEHDGLDVGTTHTHGGITRGGANTDPPNP
ncbi:phage baseplate assembly protein V [Aquibium microcysteis]|uniref:phage baseplate assembly protein V n=1 Tax=Aquibium microcysteis TaxID=675281 RepID=UPI00165D2391|nr:phage baseplate assembly protein V [Aquibium microcysteis]